MRALVVLAALALSTALLPSAQASFVDQLMPENEIDYCLDPDALAIGRSCAGPCIHCTVDWARELAESIECAIEPRELTVPICE